MLTNIKSTQTNIMNVVHCFIYITNEMDSEVWTILYKMIYVDIRNSNIHERIAAIFPENVRKGLETQKTCMNSYIQNWYFLKYDIQKK